MLIEKPSLLVSYVFLRRFLKVRKILKFGYRHWTMDSGAYSTWSRGAVINLDEYIDDCIKLKESDSKLLEIFSLDVLGGRRTGISYEHAARKTLENTQKMWKMGIEAIPVYHLGEPIEFLVELARQFPKIALGGFTVLSNKKKIKWANQCFSKIWPKKIHAFGVSSEAVLTKLPFHSADASTWSLRPGGYGHWRAFGNQQLRTREYENQDLTAEVLYQIKIEKMIQQLWVKEMYKLDKKEKVTRPDIKITYVYSDRVERALSTLDEDEFEKRRATVTRQVGKRRKENE